MRGLKIWIHSSFMAYRLKMQNSSLEILIWHEPNAGKFLKYSCPNRENSELILAMTCGGVAGDDSPPEAEARAHAAK